MIAGLEFPTWNFYNRFSECGGLRAVSLLAAMLVLTYKGRFTLFLFDHRHLDEALVMTQLLQRRHALQIVAGAMLAARCTFAVQPARTIGFGFSLYGMKQLSVLDALKVCAEAGYDCVELPVMPDWPAAPQRLSSDARSQLRDALAENQLRLSAIMENLVLLAPDAEHAVNLDRLRSAAALGHELQPGQRVVIESVMGGKPSDWDAVRSAMVDRLGTWAEVGKQTESIIAVKAHVSGAAHRPEHLRWLLDQVKSPWLRAAFDYSHFQLRGIALRDAWNELARDTVFIHVKDSTGDLAKFQFVLPGDGTIDYAEYFQLLAQSEYSGDVLVEVSGQLHGRANYDPVAACKRSYAVAEKIKQAGLTRD